MFRTKHWVKGSAHVDLPGMSGVLRNNTIITTQCMLVIYAKLCSQGYDQLLCLWRVIMCTGIHEASNFMYLGNIMTWQGDTAIEKVLTHS